MIAVLFASALADNWVAAPGGYYSAEDMRRDWDICYVKSDAVQRAPDGRASLLSHEPLVGDDDDHTTVFAEIYRCVHPLDNPIVKNWVRCRRCLWQRVLDDARVMPAVDLLLGAIHGTVALILSVGFLLVFYVGIVMPCILVGFARLYTVRGTGTT